MKIKEQIYRLRYHYRILFAPNIDEDCLYRGRRSLTKTNNQGDVLHQTVRVMILKLYICSFFSIYSKTKSTGFCPFLEHLPSAFLCCDLLDYRQQLHRLVIDFFYSPSGYAVPVHNGLPAVDGLNRL